MAGILAQHFTLGDNLIKIMLSAKKEGMISIRKDYPFSAKNQLEESYRSNPEVENLVKLATWNFANGDFELSERQYKDALQSNPNYIPALFWLAYLYEEQKKYEDALILYQVVFDKSKSNDVALYIAIVKRFLEK